MTITSLIVKNISRDQNLYVKIAKWVFISTTSVKKVGALPGTEKIKKPGRKPLIFC